MIRRKTSIAQGTCCWLDWVPSNCKTMTIHREMRRFLWHLQVVLHWRLQETETKNLTFKCWWSKCSKCTRHKVCTNGIRMEVAENETLPANHPPLGGKPIKINSQIYPARIIIPNLQRNPYPYCLEQRHSKVEEVTSSCLPQEYSWDASWDNKLKQHQVWPSHRQSLSNLFRSNLQFCKDGCKDGEESQEHRSVQERKETQQIKTQSLTTQLMIPDHKANVTNNRINPIQSSIVRNKWKYTPKLHPASGISHRRPNIAQAIDEATELRIDERTGTAQQKYTETHQIPILVQSAINN